MTDELKKDYYTETGKKLHYIAVGDANNTSFVLIHGQGMCSKDYEPVFEELTSNYMVYAVDCIGHGESEKDAALYRCDIIGDAISEFIQNVIGKPCLISGHSSGGILAAYVAVKIPESVMGLLLEDPPFFNVQGEELQNTFVYEDGFRVTHEFLNQTEENEYLVYYIEHGYLFNYLGQKYFGKEWAHKLAEEAKEELQREPGTIPHLNKVPEDAFHGLEYYDNFDLLFSESFYSGSWFDGVNQEEILRFVQCPTVYLKAKTKYGKDGVLWAANSDKSADRVISLIKNGRRKDVRSGHDIHYEKPKKFLKAVKLLEKQIDR